MADTPPFPAVPRTRHRLLRGSADEHETFVGLFGELTYDTTNRTVRVHDGETPGGFSLVNENHTHSVTVQDIEGLPKPATDDAGKFLRVDNAGAYALTDSSTSVTTEAIVDASPLGRTLMRAADSQTVRAVLDVYKDIPSLPMPTATQAGDIVQVDTSGKYALSPLPPGVPSGFIGMWSGSFASVPAGWLLCDGTNGTPDLRNRFIVGAGSTYAPQATGGVASATTSTAGAHGHNVSVGVTTLTLAQIPSHAHTINLWNTDGSGRGVENSFTIPYNAVGHATSYAGGSGGHNHTASTDAQGNHAHTVATLPPYYALCFIMKE